jgi:hypothetical protein
MRIFDLKWGLQFGGVDGGFPKSVRIIADAKCCYGESVIAVVHTLDKSNLIAHVPHTLVVGFYRMIIIASPQPASVPQKVLHIKHALGSLVWPYSHIHSVKVHPHAMLAEASCAVWVLKFKVLEIF